VANPTIEIPGGVVASGLAKATLVTPGTVITVQDTAEKGAANGYASLDGSGKVPSGQLPAAGGVTSLNALTGAVTISAGANVTLTPSGNDIAIASSGGGTPTGLILISAQALAAPAATIDFSSIPATYTHLLLMWNVRGTAAAALANMSLRLNNDSAGNYDSVRQIDGTGVTAAAGTSLALAQIPANTATAGQAGTGRCELPYYVDTTFRKSVNGIGGAVETVGTTTTYHVYNSYGTWRNTAAVTRATLILDTGNFATGSLAALYGWA
jgi:hypothetical protein